MPSRKLKLKRTPRIKRLRIRKSLTDPSPKERPLLRAEL